MKLRGDRAAFGGPGISPRWTQGNKDGVGTAYSQDSRVWYTLFRGVLTEVYYPLIDHPQLRDLQFLLTDDAGTFHEEKRHLESRTERLGDHGLGYRIVNRDPNGDYRIEKEVIGAPNLACVLQRTRLTTRPGLHPLHLHLLAAPHLDGFGWGNNGYVVELPGRTVLAAERNGTWLAVGASIPFLRSSVGYVGSSDGWTDLNAHGHLTWEFDRAPEGNVALVGELAAVPGEEFTVGLAFGRGLPHAVATLLQALGTPYPDHRSKFLEQWDRVSGVLAPLLSSTSDGGNLLRSSYSVLLAHEDKTFPGAFIASLSIPWGFARDDADRGGYHLVWTRDLVEVALGLLAAGNVEAPRRTLVYLSTIQQTDGGFPQNGWLDGQPYRTGVQLDEVAFPILLAHRLRAAKSLGEFDPLPMVRAAARFLVERSPCTQQERWEEASGYSPSTLAAVIAALVAAASLVRGSGDDAGARFLEESADFLESKVEQWTFAGTGKRAGGGGHYIRIRPVDPQDPTPEEDPNEGVLVVANQPPGIPSEYPAAEILDAGFLELVRFGIRRPDDPCILSSLGGVDATLKVDTPFGAVWHRYTHDGYGEPKDGGPYMGSGVGRAWPLLTGERGHYEIAAGRDGRPYLTALERFAGTTGLLSEQVWDEADRRELHLELGRPTGSARPLAWAHAEYLKLARSLRDGAVFDQVAEVVARYRDHRPARVLGEVWAHHRRPGTVDAGSALRIQASEPFRLHWSADGWKTAQDQEAQATSIGVSFVDLERLPPEGSHIEFTFFWPGRSAWEGRDYSVAVGPRAPSRSPG